MLPDGSALITGGRGPAGVLVSSEAFRASGQLVSGPSMMQARADHVCAALPDGRLLVAGGSTDGGGITNSAEIFTPETQSWSALGPMLTARSGATASNLPDGRVLIAGGKSAGAALATLELFDPATNSFISISRVMTSPRQEHAATTLRDGRVLLAGGSDGQKALDSVEIFDPATGGVTLVGHMSTARAGLSATTLLDGRVYLAGGNNGQANLATAELFDVAQGTFSPAADMTVARTGHVAIRIPANNSILLVGGIANDQPGAAAELYVPWWNSYKRLPALAIGSGKPALVPLKQTGDIMMAGATTAHVLTVPAIVTDKADYSPGQTIIFTGSNWQPAEKVTMTLHRDPTTAPDTVLTAIADGSGNFLCPDTAEPNSACRYLVATFDAGVTFTLTATGDKGSTAQTITFTDSTNYKTNTTLTLPSSLSPSQSYSFSGTVSTDSGVSPPPSGTVRLQRFPGSGCNGNATEIAVSLTGTTPRSFAGSFTAPSSGGTYSYQAKFDEFDDDTGKWLPSASNCQTFVINASSSTTLTIASASGTYNGAATLAATLTANGSGVSGKSVAFTLPAGGTGCLATTDANGVASCTGNLGTIAVGSYPTGVAATFAGDSSYSATSATGSLNVSQASSTVTVTCPASVPYTGVAQTPCTATVTGIGGLSQSLTVNYTANTNAGTATAAATFQGDATHSGGTDTKTFAIDKAPSTVTVSCPSSVTYTGAAQEPCTATATGAGNLSQSLTVTYTNNTTAGTANAGATFPGDTNHTESNSSTTFTIAKASSTVTFSCPTSVTYTGTALEPCTATATGAGNLSQALTVTYTNNTTAGTANASATFPGDTNHTESNGSTTFAIAKASSTVTFSCPTSVTYTGAAQEPCTATATGAGNLSQSLTVTYTNNTTAGTANASATFPGDTNHNESNGSTTFTIAKAPSTVTFSCPTSVTYTGAAQEPCTATASGAGNLSQSLTVTYTNNTTAGTANASAAFPGDANHTESNGSTTFAIAKAPSTVTVTCSGNDTYDGTPHTPCTANVTGAGGLNQPVTVSYTDNVNAGTVTASASYSGDSNHLGSNGSGTFTISQASSKTVVTCTPNETYNGAAHTPCTANVTGAGGLNQSVTVNYTDNVNAGTATATANFQGDANHTASADSKTFPIAQASSTVKLNCPASVTYTGAAQMQCTATATGAGNLNQPVAVTYANNTNAGTATATATYSGDTNHTGSSDSKTFTILAAPSTVTVVCSGSPTYTGAPLTPCSATVTSADIVNQPLTVGYANNTNAGTATASATFPGDANHTGSSDSKTFTIAKAGSTTALTCPTTPVIYSGSALTPCSAIATGAGNLNQPVTVGYTNNVSVGTATAIATFAGDANHTGSSDQKSFAIQYAPAGSACLGQPGHTVLAPVNADNTSIFKQGSTVPVKFRVCDAGGRSVGIPVVKTFFMTQIAAGTVGEPNESVDSTTPDSSFRWDPSAQQWIFNVSTKAMQGSSMYAYRITLYDGTTIDFQFGLK